MKVPHSSSISYHLREVMMVYPFSIIFSPTFYPEANLHPFETMKIPAHTNDFTDKSPYNS